MRYTLMMLARFGAAGAHRPAVKHDISCATARVHQHCQRRQCVTNELAAGVQNSCDTPLMMLARFGAAGAQTSSQHAVSRL
jgi:hypothetical protein